MLNALRLICLLVTLSSGTTWFLWTQRPKQVAKLDAYIVQKYEKMYDARFMSAVRVSGRPEGIRRFEKLAESLESVDKMDRLYGLKRQVLSNIIRHYENVGQIGRALEYADRYYQLDDRDLHNAGKRALLMLDSPDRSADALLEIPALYRRAPETRAVALAYVAYCVETGQYRNAFRAALDTRKSLPLFWNAYWNVGDGFSADSMATIELKHEKDDRYSTVLRIPGSRRLRIDLPADSEIAITSWELTFWTGQEPSVHDGADLVESLHQMRERNGTLYGEAMLDPFVVLTVPEEFHAVERVAVGIQFRLQALIPSALAPLKGNAEVMADIISWLESEGSEEEVAFVKEWMTF